MPDVPLPAPQFSKAILVGGNFQDNAGNPLSLGYLTFTLNHDSNVSVLGAPSGSQVIAGVTTKFYLDVNGSAAPNSGIWTNDVLLPSGSYYTVRAFDSSGIEVWSSPQIYTLSQGPAETLVAFKIDLGSLIPSTP